MNTYWWISYMVSSTLGLASGGLWGARFGLLTAGIVLLGFALVAKAKARRARSERR